LRAARARAADRPQAAVQRAMKRPGPAAVVVLAGLSAAPPRGKLPPALPVLQQELGVSLLQAGFLLSLVQLAGMTLGLAIGGAADALGARPPMRARPLGAGL